MVLNCMHRRQFNSCYPYYVMWCEGGQCVAVSVECVCKFCGCVGAEKYYLLRCEWANCGQLQVNRDNIRQIVKVLLVIGLHR